MAGGHAVFDALMYMRHDKQTTIGKGETARRHFDAIAETYKEEIPDSSTRCFGFSGTPSFRSPRRSIGLEESTGFRRNDCRRNSGLRFRILFFLRSFQTFCRAQYCPSPAEWRKLWSEAPLENSPLISLSSFAKSNAVIRGFWLQSFAVN